jgi:16S rRNA (guanine527-N7)-methyltransferase
MDGGADADAGTMGAALPSGAIASAAQAIFGDRLPLAQAYADLLATDGVIRGLIGPRETPRLWDRHILNCAVVAELIPIGASVLDVGSGAGLPGIVLAVARPDLTVTLVEPLARRTAFLTEAVTALDLTGTVTVLRARAEECVGGPQAGILSPADIVTARAVAPLDRLAAWCLPLAALGGRLLALKGAAAADEVTQHRDAIARLGGAAPVVRQCGQNLLDPPTTVVDIVRERAVVPAGPRPGRTPGRTSRRSTSDGGGGRGRPRRR